MIKTAVLMTFAAISAFAQTAPAPPLTLDQAKAAMDRADKHKAEVDKEAADAEAAYHKLQGLIQPSTEQANAMLLLYSKWQAEVLSSEVSLPKQFQDALKRSQENAAKLAKEYQEKLAALKVKDNAVDCAGLDIEQNWSGCKGAAAK